MNFFISFFFSFTGSLTPGTINMSAVQLGLDKKPQIAWRLGAAAALMEYIYAWLAVKFEAFISAAPFLIRHFQLIAALVMLGLGALALRAASRQSPFTERFYNSGFRRGLVLGVLNPLSMPFWLAVVAYCKTLHWIKLETAFQLHSFLAGVSCGVFCLLVLAAYLAHKLVRLLDARQSLLRRIPALIMLILGSFGLIRYFLHA